MAKIVDFNNYPVRGFPDGEGGQWAETQAVAEEVVGSKLCDVVLITKKPGFKPLNVDHLHPRREEFFVVLEGRAEALIDGEKVILTPGMVVFVPAEERHFLHLRAIPLDDKPFKMLEVGSPLGASLEEDVFLGDSEKTAKMLISGAERIYPEGWDGPRW